MHTMNYSDQLTSALRNQIIREIAQLMLDKSAKHLIINKRSKS
jgi:hypothetical protein